MKIILSSFMVVNLIPPTRSYKNNKNHVLCHHSLTADSGVWYGLGVGLAVLVLVAIPILILIYLARRVKRIYNSPAARSTAAVTQQHNMMYNPTRGAVTFQNRPGGVMGLTSADPPSYDEVQAEKGKYAVPFPPPYHSLQPSDVDATTVQI
jgi:hypothetical protein